MPNWIVDCNVQPKLPLLPLQEAVYSFNNHDTLLQWLPELLWKPLQAGIATFQAAIMSSLFLHTFPDTINTLYMTSLGEPGLIHKWT